MANAATLKGRTPYRGFHLGWPGSGKTGALVALANAGYKLRVLDFDGNFAPILAYVDDRALPNIDIVTLQDRMTNGDKYVEVVGIPTAFNDAAKMMKEWKYKDENDVEVNLGKSAEWGLDTIVVIDTYTMMARMAKNRAMKMNNKNPGNMTSAVWGQAVADAGNLLSIMKADRNGFHLIVNTHKQILGPTDFLNQNDDKEENSAIKEQKLQMIRDGMIPPRVYPIGVTKPSSQSLAGELPIMLEFEKITKLGKDLRVIKTISGPEIDVKIPGKDLKGQYPQDTGLLDIFTALGYKAPGF